MSSLSCFYIIRDGGEIYKSAQILTSLDRCSGVMPLLLIGMILSEIMFHGCRHLSKQVFCFTALAFWRFCLLYCFLLYCFLLYSIAKCSNCFLLYCPLYILLWLQATYQASLRFCPRAKLTTKQVFCVQPSSIRNNEIMRGRQFKGVTCQLH